MTILEKPRKNHFSVIRTGRKWLECNECSYEKPRRCLGRITRISFSGDGLGWLVPSPLHWKLGLKGGGRQPQGPLCVSHHAAASTQAGGT